MALDINKLLKRVLEGVIFQLLLPRANGQGRVPAVEVLVGTVAVQTLEQSLTSLVNRGEITVAEARSRAIDRYDKHTPYYYYVGQCDNSSNAYENSTEILKSTR